MKKRFVDLTDFEWSVLKATLEIPMGETRSYKWVAQSIGNPRAVRAVGQALRKNPYPLIIPCHRVIKSDGQFGAYAGKMDNKKRDLIHFEQDLEDLLHCKVDVVTDDGLHPLLRDDIYLDAMPL